MGNEFADITFWSFIIKGLAVFAFGLILTAVIIKIYEHRS